MPWHEEVLVGASGHFLGQDKIKARIKSRMFRIAAEARILCYDNPGQGVPSSFGEFVEWSLAAGPAGACIVEESAYQVAYLDFRFYAKLPRDAGELFTLFFDALTDEDGNANRYRGTWNGKSVGPVSWDRESYNETFDLATRMTQITCGLVLRYENVEANEG